MIQDTRFERIEFAREKMAEAGGSPKLVSDF